MDFFPSKMSQKKVIEKIPRCTVWSSETLESKALIPNFMKPTHKKIEKIDQRFRIQPLQGETSFALHK